MPNEFEKQVRQKMNELDFVPAEPVWTKIEEQIRSKKEKKRMIFWLPVVALLLGGGVLWLSLSNGDNQTLSSNEQPVAAPGTNEEKDNATTYAPGTVSPPVNVNEEKPQENIIAEYIDLARILQRLWRLAFHLSPNVSEFFVDGKIDLVSAFTIVFQTALQ